ncbi:MAG TPA: iron chelate uptake ABC transporter family permease subunit [Plantibacter sp.]|uniref:FecCD family ABC transporter permease n=1 Tax=unclassified Plantibacter TaxID=2624265 RepID=UPI002BD4F590|nr:iron chelate uptake ABC transporter family permease subunit [Plantibacter sp.]
MTGVGIRERTEPTATQLPHTRVLRLGGLIALPVRRRSVVVCLLVVALIIVAGAATLTMGRLGIAFGELLTAIIVPPDGTTAFVLERLRGPRLLTAIGVGAALGIAGTLFQTVTRNPLGSPDVIGLGAGAGAGVAVTTLLWNGLVPTPLGALGGAVIAIALVHLATGRGFASPSRVIIAGIGVAAMAAAVTQYVVSIGLRDQASQLAAALAGSLNATDWNDVAVLAVTIAVVLPVAGALGGELRLIELGDDATDALGARAIRTRTIAILLSVVAAAGAVTAAGPIAFVALTAPQIARRATRTAGPNLVASALVGAAIMVTADLVVQQSPWADGLPVGVLTAGVGGIYLGFLLIREWRLGRV